MLRCHGDKAANFCHDKGTAPENTHRVSIKFPNPETNVKRPCIDHKTIQQVLQGFRCEAIDKNPAERQAASSAAQCTREAKDTRCRIEVSSLCLAGPKRVSSPESRRLEDSTERGKLSSSMRCWPGGGASSWACSRTQVSGGGERRRGGRRRERVDVAFDAVAEHPCGGRESWLRVMTPR